MTDDQIKFIIPIAQQAAAMLGAAVVTYLAGVAYRLIKSIKTKSAPTWAAKKNGLMTALRHIYVLAFFAFMINPLAQLEAPTGWDVLKIVFWTFFMLLYWVRSIVDGPVSTD